MNGVISKSKSCWDMEFKALKNHRALLSQTVFQISIFVLDCFRKIFLRKIWGLKFNLFHNWFIYFGWLIKAEIQRRAKIALFVTLRKRWYYLYRLFFLLTVFRRCLIRPFSWMSDFFWVLYPLSLILWLVVSIIFFMELFSAKTYFFRFFTAIILVLIVSLISVTKVVDDFGLELLLFFLVYFFEGHSHDFLELFYFLIHLQV